MRTLPALPSAAALVAAALLTAPVAVAGPGHGPGPGPGHGPARGACAGLEALFCEDFESHPVGGASSEEWDVDTRHGTLRVERANRPGTAGKAAGKALHVRTRDNGMAFLEVNDVDVPDNTFWGRLRVKVDDFPTAPDWAHFTLVEVTGTGSDEIVRPLGGQFAPTVGPDATFWGVGADGGPTGDWTSWQESAPTVEDRWQCVEIEWYAPENRVALWFDGVPQPDLTVTTTDHGGADTDFVLPVAQTVRVGWQLYQGGATPDRFDVWIDDIALATDRIGC